MTVRDATNTEPTWPTFPHKVEPQTRPEMCWADATKTGDVRRCGNIPVSEIGLCSWHLAEFREASKEVA